ncbi:MAG: hypothetical protein IKZ59_06030 [Clostridia bacterium]|nr:hypothetical protein [Clostridia bacterium]
MQTEKLWLKFIISGKPEVYLDYVNQRNLEYKAVDENSLFNGCSCNKGNGDRG